MWVWFITPVTGCLSNMGYIENIVTNFLCTLLRLCFLTLQTGLSLYHHRQLSTIHSDKALNKSVLYDNVFVRMFFVLQEEGFEISVTCFYCNLQLRGSSLLSPLTLYEQLLDQFNLSTTAHFLADFMPHNRCRDLSVFFCPHMKDFTKAAVAAAPGAEITGSR